MSGTLFLSPGLRSEKEKGTVKVTLTGNSSEFLQDRAGPLGGIPKHNFCLPLELGQDRGAAEQGPYSGHHHPG